jgi:transglutaminase-like putative cysteine protease
MRLKIKHQTSYTYDAAPSYLIQRLHLQPAAFATQKILSWNIAAAGIESGLSYVDGFGNTVHVITAQAQVGEASIVAEGEVETQDSAGVVRGLRSSAPDAVFLRETPLTTSSEALKEFASGFSGSANALQRAHAIMAGVQGKVVYETGTSHSYTTAAEAFAEGRGVCQDHAHVIIAVARELGIPARYVTGYLVTGTGASSSAAHAWAEILIPELGWVGFDAANGQCPTELYVRVASGLDAAAIAPVRGMRRGGSSGEHMTVEVSVEIAQQ